MTEKHDGRKRQQQSDRFTDNRASDVTEHDLSDKKMGDNALQGDDQGNIHNQRHTQPDSKTDTDNIVESLEKMDKDVRAKRDLGKGNRS